MTEGETLPRLSDLLRVVCLAEIAREIGKPRDYVWRLRHGARVRDDSIIEPLAKALHQNPDFIRRVVAADRKRAA